MSAAGPPPPIGEDGSLYASVADALAAPPAALQQDGMASPRAPPVPPSPPPVTTEVVSESPMGGSALRMAAGHRGIAVDHEDCILIGDLSHMVGQPMSAAPELGKVRGDVYVQHARDTSRFKPVPADKVRKAYQIGAAHSRGERLQKKKCEESGILEFSSRFVAQEDPVEDSLVSLDPDASRLHFITERLDADIMELLLEQKSCECRMNFLSMVGQLILGGLSIAAGFVAAGANAEVLTLIMKVVDPGFSRLTMILSEVLTIFSILELVAAYEHFRTILKKGNADIEGANAELDATGAAEHRSRRLAIRQLLLSGIRTLGNIGIVLACLLGTPNDVFLRYGQASMGWSPSLAKTQLLTQAICGVFAAGAALPRAYASSSPTVQPLLNKMLSGGGGGSFQSMTARWPPDLEASADHNMAFDASKLDESWASAITRHNESRLS
eukprot:TRINITY_DN15935_c0_g1_i1.p1 TRINITY_DN15935_c0_g1~~TRINITY_DN15935_c0_g1_i1.p1  ORF type:complete len:441 (+),score=111.37 TRINITY_DN15935_c0_g1_i1:80-1402(+)